MSSLLLTTGDKLPDCLLPYKPRLSPRFFKVRQMVQKFIFEVILPKYSLYKKQSKEMAEAGNHFGEPPLLNEFRQQAKERGLWNLFLPDSSGQVGGGLTNLEYAPIAEMMGAIPVCSMAMNCAAPDTGNMEVLHRFGTPEQQEKWLEPLLNADIRSAFAMTEPMVASSDATNIETTVVRDGDDYVINGVKWYISGAMRPECKVFILLGVSDLRAPSHKRHTMVLIPRGTPGVTVHRPMAVFGIEHDHAEISFKDVRVPKENIILGEGRGFEVAQGRLGPGRIHHCMRVIGVAEMALAALVYRAKTRRAFGSTLAEKDTIREIIANARIEIEKCRGLCMLAATMMDEYGPKGAKKYIAMIKVAAPTMALKIIDEAIQVHGARGVSQDTPLWHMYTGVRTLRLADGPDVVHKNTIAKDELKLISPIGARISGTYTHPLQRTATDINSQL